MGACTLNSSGADKDFGDMILSRRVRKTVLLQCSLFKVQEAGLLLLLHLAAYLVFNAYFLHLEIRTLCTKGENGVPVF